jgi:hypothetical protein
MTTSRSCPSRKEAAHEPRAQRRGLRTLESVNARTQAKELSGDLGKVRLGGGARRSGLRDRFEEQRGLLSHDGAP